MSTVRGFRRWVAILTLLLSVAALRAEGLVWQGVDRVVAIGDIHGDYDQFVKCLLAAKVVDADLNWLGGRTHLVQTGDVPHRGPGTREAMDLLRKLQRQAPESGGRVHCLIGNHEGMVLVGSSWESTPEEIAGFGGRDELLRLLGPEGEYGRWILGNPTVLKINDMVFVHAGISPEHLNLTLEQVHERSLGEVKSGVVGLNRNKMSALWFRGLAQDDEQQQMPFVEQIGRQFDARHFVIGHTVSRTGVRTRFDGRVIMIDVGMTARFGGPAECLIVEGDEKLAVQIGKGRVLLSGADPAAQPR
jgi:hypothetical protein